MALKVQESDDRLVVQFQGTGILGEAAVAEFSATLQDVVKRAEQLGKRVLIDLNGIQLVTSTVIGQMLMINRLSREASVDLRLTNVCDELRDVFRAIRLLNVFRFEDPPAGDAIAAG